MKRLFFWIVVAGLTMTATAQRLTSPNKKLSVEVNNGQWIIGFQGQQVLTMKGAETFGVQKMVKAKKIKADYPSCTITKDNVYPIRWNPEDLLPEDADELQ